MGYSCIVCSRGVRKNSKALECEECKEWCHIRCGIEITLAQYELVTQGKLEYEWTCHLCSEPAPKRQRTRSPTPSPPRQRTPTPPRLLNVTLLRLVSSHNHTYNFKKTLKRTGATVWQCSVRNKNIYCTAMVTQLGDIYTPGSAPHKCVPKCAALPAARIQAQI